MSSSLHRVIQIFTLALPNLLVTVAAWAQVTPDATTGTAVNGVLDITGGTTAGGNLFHSFDQFSVNVGETATFINNAAAVSNVIGRVTGTLPSLIDGELAAGGTNPNFNLYLINPNGITFGPNANLSLNGSLFASTAESVVFNNGVFSTDLGATTNPLLLVDVPTGLQTGANPGNLRVQGDLFLNPGTTLGLLGGNVTVDNNIIALQQGNIEIGGVGPNSQVELTANARFDYGNVTRFRDLTFTNQAAVSALAGDINLYGRNILVEGGTAVAVNPTGAGLNGGTLQAVATGRVTLDGGAQLTPTNFIPSGFYGQNLGGAGDAGDIRVQASEVVLSNGGVIFNSTNSINGLGRGGNTVVNGTNQVLITGQSAAGSPSGIFSQALPAATAAAGNIVINTPNLTVEQGAGISASTAGLGAQGGNVTVSAGQILINEASIDAQTTGTNAPGGQIAITTNRLDIINRGQISAETAGAGSAGGSVGVTTDTLTLASGGRITTSTEASGQGGTTTIEANQVQLTGAASGIFSEALVTATGDSGNIAINAPVLRLDDRARISTSTAGNGAAGGNITTTGNQLLIANEASIAAETTGTNAPGGQIAITTNRLDIINRGQISAETAGAGSAGGSVGVTTDTLTLASGGRITTSTEASGQGGTTTIEANQVQLTGAASGILSEATATATASGGDIRLNANGLEVTDGAQISVSDLGSGGAGNVTITAGDILLRNQASIQGRTNATTGGNLIFDVDGNIVMRFNSLISAQSLGTGSGGNIIFDVDGFILAVLSENSDVLAGSALGLGGEITGRALGVYGFREFMGVVTPESDFTAGLDGIVNIQTQEVQPQESLGQNLARNDVSEGCNATAAQDAESHTQSSLMMLGQGGLPVSAANVSAPNSLWVTPVGPIGESHHSVAGGQEVSSQQPASLTATPCQAR